MSISDIAFLDDLEHIIRERINDPSDDSYTATLVKAGRRRLAQKVGEEGVELALASAGGDRDEVIDEASDLIYHVLVLLADQKLSLKDVCARLRARHESQQATTLK